LYVNLKFIERDKGSINALPLFLIRETLIRPEDERIIAKLSGVINPKIGLVFPKILNVIILS